MPKTPFDGFADLMGQNHRWFGEFLDTPTHRMLLEMNDTIWRTTELSGLSDMLLDSEAARGTMSTLSDIDLDSLGLARMSVFEELNRTQSIVGPLMPACQAFFSSATMRDGAAEILNWAERDRKLQEDILDVAGFNRLTEMASIWASRHLELDAMCSISTSAQSVLASLDWPSLGGRIGIDVDQQLQLQRSAVRLAQTYSEIYTSLLESDRSFESIVPEVTLEPPVNVLAHSRSLRIITTATDSEALVVEVRAEIVESTFGFVGEHLGAFNPKYVAMLRGARRSAVERGEDWVRHAASSYRQLMKNLLHRVAPSDVVRPWANGKGDLDDRGFPKRRTKLRWLCKDVEPESYRTFLVEDIDSALRLIGVLDDAVHEDDFDICEKEFAWISLRVERALQELLKLWLTERRNS